MPFAPHEEVQDIIMPYVLLNINIRDLNILLGVLLRKLTKHVNHKVQQLHDNNPYASSLKIKRPADLVQ